jgi:hypothetical protein
VIDLPCCIPHPGLGLSFFSGSRRLEGKRLWL